MMEENDVLSGDILDGATVALGFAREKHVTDTCNGAGSLAGVAHDLRWHLFDVIGKYRRALEFMQERQSKLDGVFAAIRNAVSDGEIQQTARLLDHLAQYGFARDFRHYVTIHVTHTVEGEVVVPLGTSIEDIGDHIRDEFTFALDVRSFSRDLRWEQYEVTGEVGEVEVEDY